MLKGKRADLDFAKIFRNFALDQWGKPGTMRAFPFLVSRQEAKLQSTCTKLQRTWLKLQRTWEKLSGTWFFPGATWLFGRSLWRVTKRAIKQPFHIVYIKVLGAVRQKGHSAALLSDAGWGMYLSKRLGALSEPPCSLPLLTPPQGCSQNHHSDTPLIRNYTIRLSMTSSRLPGRRSITGTSIIV